MSFACDYHRPTTLDEAWTLAARTPGARFIAGGTDVMVRIREGKVRPPALISLRAIADLRRSDLGAPIVIGAGVRLADLAASRDLERALPVLVQAARRVGSVQIRNAATLGGNLCNASPCADTAPPLLALDARVELASAAGMREVSLSEFFVGPRASILQPGEILRAVVVDPIGPAVRGSFLKKGRVQMDIALASVAVVLELDGRRCVRARVAVGSLGPRPMRLPTVERVLGGASIDAGVLAAARAAAEAEVRPISDVRAGADYRRHLAGVLLERGVRTILDGAPS